MSAKKTRQVFRRILESHIQAEKVMEIDVKVQKWLLKLLDHIDTLEKHSNTPESGFDVSEHHDAGP